MRRSCLRDEVFGVGSIKVRENDKTTKLIFNTYNNF